MQILIKNDILKTSIANKYLLFLHITKDSLASHMQLFRDQQLKKVPSPFLQNGFENFWSLSFCFQTLDQSNAEEKSLFQN